MSDAAEFPRLDLRSGEASEVRNSADHATEISGVRTNALRESLDELVAVGFPAAIATWSSPDGQYVSRAAGIADRATGREAEPDQLVRVGSSTKMFTAVVVMQLVDEGRVDLDGSIEDQLPGVLHGEGIDGRLVSVRHLLQHTSGLPDYVGALMSDDAAFFRDTSPGDLLNIAFQAPPVCAPGERWAYSNTNYLVLGLLIEAVTGNSLEDEVTHRILTPLKLVKTLMPRGGERTIPEPHLRGYHLDRGREGLADWTETDPSSAWGSGQIISTPAELNIFLQALLSGELTSSEALTQMTTTVPADETFWPGTRYGLGLQFYPLSSGGTAWGHGGDFPGYQTRNAVREDGVAVTITVTALPPAFIDSADVPALMDAYHRVSSALDSALTSEYV